MYQLIVGIWMVAALLTAGSAAGADTPAEMLEKGIYTEETVGDLDGAIKIYEKIIAEAKANRKYVAEAQLRLGRCLRKLGKTAEAEKALRAMVDQFKDTAELKQLVEKAQALLPERSGLKLDPVPWADGEHLELRIKLGRLDIGDFILSARSAKVEGQEVWQLALSRNIAVNAPNLGRSEVVVDAQTFRPMRSVFRHTLLGNVEAEYATHEVKIDSIQNDGEMSTETLSLDGIYYDNEQGWHLFRRLPLTEGYQGTVPICATFGAGPIKLDVEVTGKETVRVPAGEFECYKLLVKQVQQTFWFSADAKRYVVKFEAGGVTGVLQSIRHVRPGDTVEYTDEKFGFRLTAPADWYFHPSPEGTSQTKALILLTDPKAEAISSLTVEPLNELSDEEKTSVRKWADAEMAVNQKTHQEFQLRADSWRQFQVGGSAAVSCIADYTQRGKKRAQYNVLIMGPRAAAQFTADVSPERLDDFRAPFDKIVESYQLK